MATNGYPKIPLKAWRTLRSKAASAPSTKFTPSVVAALMGMASPESAANNTVAPMRRLGPHRGGRIAHASRQQMARRRLLRRGLPGDAR